MNLQDLAKKTLDEMDSENSSSAHAQRYEQKNTTKNAEVIDFMPSYKTPSELQVGTSYVLSSSEARFLSNVKERVLVLFEGLKSAKSEDLETRLDLTINFLEFLLASIEDKLKK